MTGYSVLKMLFFTLEVATYICFSGVLTDDGLVIVEGVFYLLTFCVMLSSVVWRAITPPPAVIQEHLFYFFCFFVSAKSVDNIHVVWKK